MPQPIHYDRLIAFSFHPLAILQRPELAAHIAAISAIWNEIDASIASFLTALLGGEAKTGISIYFAITNDGAKRAALDAICSLKLSKDEQETFQVILKTISLRYKERNSAVHGAWGTSPVYPDGLLWSDARNVILMHVDLLAYPGVDKQPERDKIMLKEQRKIQVWKDPDFQAVEKRLEQVRHELNEFARPFMLQTYAPIAKTLGPVPEPPPR